MKAVFSLLVLAVLQAVIAGKVIKTKSKSSVSKIADPESTVPTVSNECFCDYIPSDENLIAYADEKPLKLGDRISVNTTVKFTCKNLDIQHIGGLHEMTCEKCQAWDSTVLPRCLEPESDDIDPVIKTLFLPTPTFQDPISEDCSCIYISYDKNLVAYTKENQLQIGDKISRNTVVKFRCKEIGIQRIEGPEEMTCEKCNVWDSTILPRCLEPETGSTKIIFDETIDTSMEGHLQIRAGDNIRLTCISVGIADYPLWSFPVSSIFRITRERITQENGEVVYVSHVDIENANRANKGPYGCKVGDNPRVFVRVVLVNSCKIPAVANGDVGRVEKIILSKYKRCIEFTKFQIGEIIAENEEVILYCDEGFAPANRSETFVAESQSIKCINGQWSQKLECKTMACLGNPPVIENAAVVIIPSRKHGQVLNYKCEWGYDKVDSGRIVCDFGEWIGPKPVCLKRDHCSLEDLTSKLPENVLTEEGNTGIVPIGTSVKLMCSDKKVMKGNGSAECIETGQWKIGSTTCVAGCPPLNKPPGSKLLMEPQKNVYMFNEVITFSCPSGMELYPKQFGSSVCLEDGWTGHNLEDVTESGVLEDKQPVDGDLAKLSDLERNWETQPTDKQNIFLPECRYVDIDRQTP